MGIQEIQNRVETGYVMSIYGNYSGIHEQMLKDINTLLDVINDSQCCEELKDLKKGKNNHRWK